MEFFNLPSSQEMEPYCCDGNTNCNSCQNPQSCNPDGDCDYNPSCNYGCPPINVPC